MQLPFPMPAQWVRRARWFIGSLLVVWVVAWLGVPPLAKRLIEEKATAALGRTVTVGGVGFRPWSLEITVTDLAVATADGRGKQLGIARLYADAELESVLRLAPVIDAITVETPTLHITHLGDGRYDVDDILQTLSEAPASASAPLPFALYNLTLNGGALDFTDHTPTGARQHSVRALYLAVPFLSTLDSKREVRVLPRLAFELNGSKFDTAAAGTPFAQTHKGEATLAIAHLDLAPYLPYLPGNLPLRVKSAVVDADLRLAFEQAAQPKLTLAGKVRVSGLALADRAGEPLLDVESMAAELSDVRPLERVVKLASLEIVAPRLRGSRNRAGRINLALGGSKDAPVASHGAAANAKAKSVPAPRPWTLALDRLTLHRGELAWLDASIQPQASLALAQLELQAQSLRFPLSTPALSFEGSAIVPSRGKPARLAFKGEGTEGLVKVHASVGELDLGLASPYTAQYLTPAVMGVLDGEVDATWQSDKLQVDVPRLSVRDFALKGSKTAATGATEAGTAQAATGGDRATSAERAASEMPRFKRLEVSDARFNVSERTGVVGKVALRSPSAMLHRDAQGQWVAQRWLTTAVDAPQAGTTADTLRNDEAPATTETLARPAEPWRLSLGELAIDDGTFKLDDRSLGRPARLEASALKLQLTNATLDGSKPAPVSLTARIKSGRTEPGTLSYRGTVMWAPLALQGGVEAVDIPLHAVAPYFADQLNIAVLRADASYKGQMRYATAAAGPEIELQGDAALEDFRANSVAGAAGAGTVPADAPDLGVAEELLSWKSLNVPGINLAMAPGAATHLQVREATLSDFFARVVVNASGRVNLQDMVKTAQPDAPDLPATAVPVAPGVPPAPAGPHAIVSMGPISLINGRVLFSDRFIRPNYSADLTELSGKLSQFASQAGDGPLQLADLDLRGRAEGTASLEITGKINPLAKPLALDIRGRVRDLDLPPLTAYSIKYAGYGIERGKLSMDVNYTVQSDGQLSATNKLVLNQLTFGDPVDGAPNSLPVKLAVALLADSNGVIDIDLPISGSLNDPQFRIGAVVWKVITNLIGRALTAPFSLLAHAFGGSTGSGEELNSVAFAPGSSELAGSVMPALDQIAKALATRAALQVTVVGSASLEAERDALKRERLKGLLLAEKRRRAVVTGQDAGLVAALTDAEYPALLKEVYRRADISKPRNIVGLAKDISTPEMEALLLASISVNEDSMRTLATQRGVVVKDYLASRKLPPERLFLGAPKTAAGGPDWKPHAELGVTSR